MAQPGSSPPLYPLIGIEESISERKDTQIEDVENNFELIQKKLTEKKDSIIKRIRGTSPIEDPQTENFQKQLVFLYTSKLNLEDSMKDPKIASTLAECYEKIQEQIIRIEKQLHTVKYLRWNMTDCENAIENLCVVCEGKDLTDIYSRKKELLWESVAPGTERTQVNGPVGLTIEPKTDHIFIADAGNNRIQVYNSEGRHLSQIKLTQSWRIFFIDFLGDFLFIVGTVSEDSLLLARMDPSTEEHVVMRLAHPGEFGRDLLTPGFNILISLNRIQLTMVASIYNDNHTIWTQCISIEKLEPSKVGKKRILRLRSPHIEDHSQAVDLKTVGKSQDKMRFLVLYQNSPYSLQIFNNNGEMVRAIISLNLDKVLSLFLVDKENNLIICTINRGVASKSEKQESDLMELLYSFYAFSDTGERLHQWTYKGSNKSVFNKIFRLFSKQIPIKQSQESHGVTLPSYHSAVNLAEIINPVFVAYLNSKQQLIVLFSLETSSLVRAF